MLRQTRLDVTAVLSLLQIEMVISIAFASMVESPLEVKPLCPGLEGKLSLG